MGILGAHGNTKRTNDRVFYYSHYSESIKYKQIETFVFNKKMNFYKKSQKHHLKILKFLIFWAIKRVSECSSKQYERK